jgi:hypothetical protein
VNGVLFPIPFLNYHLKASTHSLHNEPKMAVPPTLSLESNKTVQILKAAEEGGYGVVASIV